MSSAKSPLLILDLTPSRTLLIILGGLHILAGSALLLSAIPVAIKWFGGLLLVLSWLHHYWRYGYVGGSGFIQRLSWRADGSWLLRYGDGREIEASLQGAYPHPRLLLLNFFGRGWRRQTVVLLTDSSEADLLRKLRARLRLTQLEDEIEEEEQG